MTEVIKVKSGAKMEDIVGYSRVVAVNDLIFVSNTAGRNPETGDMPDTFAEQARHALAMIERSLKSVDASLGDVVAYRAYIPHPDDLKDAAEILGGTFRGIDPAATVTCSPLAAPYYKFEIDVTAHRGVADATAKKIKI